MQTTTITRQTVEDDAYLNFVTSLDSIVSRKLYASIFPYFMKFCNIDSYQAMLQLPTKQLESKIRDYLIYLREDKKVAAATISLYLAVITHFYEMNDLQINWRKLNKFKGKSRGVVEDVPYTRDQIKTMIDRARLRDKCMILLMTSAGLRRTALTALKLRDLQFVNKFSLYKITVYKHEQEQYITYCTPECAKVIDDYLKWRERLGEQLKPDTILFRTEFDTTTKLIVNRPRPINPDTVSRTITVLLDKTGIRSSAQGWKRSAIMQCHGFRKFFNTQCISHSMNPLYCEYMMGHKSGLIKSYFKPTDTELLEGNDKSVGYVGVIPYLTINATEQENENLRKQLQKLTVEEDHIRQLRVEIEQIKSLIGSVKLR